MSTLHQLREGLNEAWDTLLDGWQRLYRRAAGAITRFTPGKMKKSDKQGMGERSAGWGVLAAEVFEDSQKLVVSLEVPGMKKNDFDLLVLNDYLVIRGEKHVNRERTEGQYHISECAYGSFERAIPLSEPVISEKASATYKNGILRVELPKKVTQKRKQIQVEVS